MTNYIHYPQSVQFSSKAYILLDTPAFSCIEFANPNGCLYHDDANYLKVALPSIIDECYVSGGSSASSWYVVLNLDLGQVIQANGAFTLRARFSSDSPNTSPSNVSFRVKKAATDTAEVPGDASFWDVDVGTAYYLTDAWQNLTQTYGSAFKDTRWVKIELCLWDVNRGVFYVDVAGVSVISTTASPSPLPIPTAPSGWTLTHSADGIPGLILVA